MKLSSLETASENQETDYKDTGGGGLMFGINAYVIRMLCEDPFNSGGAGYTPQQVGDMTPDQVWFRACDKDIFKDGTGKGPGNTRTVNSLEAARFVDKDGMIKVRMANGELMKVPFSTQTPAGKKVNKRGT